ncbi:MAG: reverse transcriptase domain-containing protein, partial [Muribaculaceae bacterium]
MDIRQDIAARARKLQNRDDILDLLNYIKRNDDLYGGVDRPFRMKKLTYYCNPNHTKGRYKEFSIPKKSGGTRTISAPRSSTFKLMLRYVNEILKSLYTPSDHAMGFTEGRSVATNAAVHLGQNYVLNIDLKDFFPSISQARVWKRLQLPPFEFPQAVANVIAGLCAMRVDSQNDDGTETPKYVLPQGAPTSPLLTNAVCDVLDRRLGGLAKRFGLRYSRYADDITFSSMHNVFAPQGEFWTELRRIITGQGFAINEAKTRLQKRGARQEVTGVIVSNKLNVARQYSRRLRTLIHIWEKYGYYDAFRRFIPRYKATCSHKVKGEVDMARVVEGKLLYMKMLKGDNDPVYRSLRQRFDALVSGMLNFCITSSNGVSYLMTKPLIEFERDSNTEVKFRTFEDKNKLSHRYATFEIDGTANRATIRSDVPSDQELDKIKLAMSLCRKGQEELFWLIHKLKLKALADSNAVDLGE